jgi:hypothetical protein
VLAAELLGRVRAELPAISGLEEREQVLVSAWLTGLWSARTRRAYAADVTAWLGWLAGRDTGALAAHAGIGAWQQLSPHSPRHSAITFALDAGVSLRDVQDYAGHKIPALPAGTTTPATTWTATPPTPSPATWRDNTVGLPTRPPAPGSSHGREGA